MKLHIANNKITNVTSNVEDEIDHVQVLASKNDQAMQEFLAVRKQAILLSAFHVSVINKNYISFLELLIYLLFAYHFSALNYAEHNLLSLLFSIIIAAVVNRH